MPITIDYSRDDDLTEQAKELLKKYYMVTGEKSPQDAFARASEAYNGEDHELSQRIYDYVSKRWFMFSSPILSNAPKRREKSKSLPISCFLNFTPDNLEGLIDHTTETRWLSVKGGGVGAAWSSVRAVSDKSPGPLPFLKTIDADMTAYRQSSTRKGSYAAYLDISHPDIIQFINLRVPTGGDINAKCFNIHNAVNITDDFMTCAKENGIWELKCPHTGEVRDTIPARELWQRMLEIRYRTGEPYFNFIDTANRALPDEMKLKGLKLHGSNLCQEIHLPTNENRTAVCCLSSVNLEKYDEWKDTEMVEDLIKFLDNVLQYFIDNAPPELKRAVNSAKQERSLGLGAMGFHSFLQGKGIPWESAMAKSWNMNIFKHIQERADSATRQLAKERGACPDVSGVRNSHTRAIAPNANSAIICGASASIEPIKSNAYTHRTRVGSHLIKNKYLKEVLKTYNKDTDSVWNDIGMNNGSVQHLEFLSDSDKKIFKTAFEIDQMWVIEHAADRQKFVCQGQSVNLFFAAGESKCYLHAVHMKAYDRGLKGLYYLKTEAEKKAENVNAPIKREALHDYQECMSCQG